VNFAVANRRSPRTIPKHFHGGGGGDAYGVRVATPAVVPIVVPTALMHQNTAIARAAATFANSPRDMPFVIAIPSFSTANSVPPP
jgi:hypothetical protein